MLFIIIQNAGKSLKYILVKFELSRSIRFQDFAV